MGLKPHLRETLRDHIEDLNELIQETRTSQEVLEATDLDNAKYTIRLSSLWANEGGESTTTEYKGTLKDALGKAEAEFRLANNRSDVQASYSVQINLGERKYHIPEEFWEDLQEKFC